MCHRHLSFTAAQSSSSLNPSEENSNAFFTDHESLHRSADDQNRAHSAIVHSGHRASCHTQEAFSFPVENVSEVDERPLRGTYEKRHPG